MLDAHALTILSSPTALAAEWLIHIEKHFPGSVLWVPQLVLVEAKSGTPADANVNRFLKTLDNPSRPDRRWSMPAGDDYDHAARLRTQAHPYSRDGISVTDALIVAVADRMAQRRGVTILTSDVRDLELLASFTRRPNLAVPSLNL